MTCVKGLESLSSNINKIVPTNLTKNMSLMHITEYFLWKSMKDKAAPSCVGHLDIKEELLPNKQEIFDNDIMKCRVCTSHADIPITDKIHDMLIMNAIRMVANISINEADYYPKYVCKVCLGELKIALQFKKKCETSDMIFRKAISSETHLVINSQPMVMHDFPLILHQMKQKRLYQNVLVKHDENNDDDCDNDEMQRSLPSKPNQATPQSISQKLPKEMKMKKKTATEMTTHNRIIKLLKIGADFENVGAKCNVDTDIDHYKTKNTEKKLLGISKCKRCNIKFDSKEEFKKHRKLNSCVHHPCPLCGKLVLNLASHEKVVHSKTNEYTCHQCGKIYYSSGALHNHMHAHKETKEYFCEHCPYRGKRKSYLVCHMRVHTGEHRYLCAMCPLKFSNPSNLRKHQLVHFNKKFECSKCKRLFREEKVLKAHFDAAHLNIRYRCSICSRDLCSRKKLLSHELRVHKREKHKLFEEVQRVVIGNDND